MSASDLVADRPGFHGHLSSVEARAGPVKLIEWRLTGPPANQKLYNPPHLPGQHGRPRLTVVEAAGIEPAHPEWSGASS
ncbi:hypothetical protein GCM10012279_16370 [Micromonospora yangpuensis]|nr:hypothetical protein GCM10012279_16370 [Micromonospora yangpuensis]